METLLQLFENSDWQGNPKDLAVHDKLSDPHWGDRTPISDLQLEMHGEVKLDSRTIHDVSAGIL